METVVYFKIQLSSEEEKVVFNGTSSYDEIEEYFEESCGGVYKWYKVCT